MRLLGIDATLPWNVPGYSDDPSTWRRHRQLRLDVWKRLEQLATAQAQHNKEHHEYHMTSFYIIYLYIYTYFLNVAQTVRRSQRTHEVLPDVFLQYHSLLVVKTIKT